VCADQQELIMKDIETNCLEIAGEYVSRELGVPASEYQLVYRELSPETGLHVVDANHRDDLNPELVTYPGAGAGKSRQLHIDVHAREVKTALKFQ
jgi:hypothetical protein